MAVMRCYKGYKYADKDGYKIVHISQKDYLEVESLPSKFGRDKKQRSIIWQRVKGQLENKVDCKYEDDIIYVVYNIDEIDNVFLCFAIGNGKQNTLDKIFYKAEEDFKQEQSTKWDLSDESKPIQEHLKIIQNNEEVYNRFSENQCRQIVYSLLTKDVIKYVNRQEWQKALQRLAFNLNSNNEAIREYSQLERVKIAQYIKELQEEVKQPNFLQKLKKVKEYKDKIEIGVIR